MARLNFSVAVRIAVVVTTALGGLGSLAGIGCTKTADSTPEVEQPLKLAAGKDAVSLLFVGDLSVARGIADVIDKQGNGDSGYPFTRIKPLLDAHDLVFGNLECVISDSTEEEALSKTYRIRAPVKYLSSLHEAGVDVVSVANNHAMDFGAQGIKSTIAELKKEGVLPVGHLRDVGWSQPVTVVHVGNIKVGFLAYNQHGDEYKHPDWRPTVARYRIGDVVKDIKAARSRVDYLVVSVHGGLELNHEAADWQVADSRAAVDAGTDLWVGHHPHVAQPFTTYKGKLIAYSLGDFLFDKSSPWLVHRNRPRFFLEVNLQKSADGSVVVKDHKFLPGDQEPITWRPHEAPGAFVVESFQEVPMAGTAPATKTFRDRLADAAVERVHGAAVASKDAKDVKDAKQGKPTVEPCSRWEKRRMPTKAHSWRWLAPRWGCGEAKSEGNKPWQTVAATAELFQGSLKRGIWAHPHGDGPLRFRFPDVELGTRLEGFAGVPDWGIVMAEQAVAKGKPPTPPATVRVMIAAADDDADDDKHGPPASDQTVTVPYAAGTTPIVVDTASLKGQKRDVIVEVSGGSGDAEGRFVYDLQVVP